MLKAQGYSVTDACRALGIPRSGYRYGVRGKVARDKGPEMKDMDLLESIRRIKAEHPFWGHRRVWAWLRHREKEEG